MSIVGSRNWSLMLERNRRLIGVLPEIDYDRPLHLIQGMIAGCIPLQLRECVCCG